DLEVRDALARLAEGRLLAGDLADLLNGVVEHLLVNGGLADALVDGDLDEAGHLHHVVVAEALHQRRHDLFAVARLEAGGVVLHDLGVVEPAVRQCRLRAASWTGWGSPEGYEKEREARRAAR